MRILDEDTHPSIQTIVLYLTKSEGKERLLYLLPFTARQRGVDNP